MKAIKVRAEVYCGRCLRSVYLAELSAGAFELPLLLLHSSSEHASTHPLSLRLLDSNNQPVTAGELMAHGIDRAAPIVDLEFRCRHPYCEGSPPVLVPRVWRDLVAAYAIAFHSGHEGHLFELWIDGVREWPPGK